uniref:Uncharacterized protein n=1 Tax=Anopheles atroparvus TaxID=41427 RepID=A0A182JFV6_ANOAO
MQCCRTVEDNKVPNWFVLVRPRRADTSPWPVFDQSAAWSEDRFFWVKSPCERTNNNAGEKVTIAFVSAEWTNAPSSSGEMSAGLMSCVRENSPPLENIIAQEQDIPITITTPETAGKI